MPEPLVSAVDAAAEAAVVERLRQQPHPVAAREVAERLRQQPVVAVEHEAAVVVTTRPPCKRSQLDHVASGRVALPRS